MPTPQLPGRHRPLGLSTAIVRSPGPLSTNGLRPREPPRAHPDNNAANSRIVAVCLIWGFLKDTLLMHMLTRMDSLHVQHVNLLMPGVRVETLVCLMFCRW